MIHLSKGNKDLSAAMINSLWRIFAGPLMLLAIPYFLTPMEQGYWYTFTGLAALSIFADLGFTGIVLQFTAHEFAFLHFGPGRIFTGDESHLWRLASFFRFTFKWLLRAVGIVFPLIMVGGYFFIDAKHDAINWQMAWILYSMASAMAFINSTIMSFFEGCNSVSLMQSVRFRVGVCTTCTNFICLVMGFNLYALALAQCVNAAAGLLYLCYYFQQSMKQLWKLSMGKCYNWWPEFSSLIWRYAISWCSGFFIFQLFTPLAFQFHGAVFSGKIGISIAMWTAGVGIANTFITAILPRMNMLISKHQWKELDALFHKNLMLTMGTMVLGGIGYFILYYLLKDKMTFFQRVLDPFNMGILYISWILETWVGSIASYLRAHKKEPLMPISALSGIYVAITTWLCAKYLSPEYLFMGFLTQFVFVIPVVYHIYKKQKEDHIIVEIAESKQTG